ncbi:hypothetical protein [Methylorubrum extorquens]|nr:hypothetical protein [Methylorubrum extorquens]MCP1545342.1 hypothetical protein [Methylorubrum extorquens]MCP1587311.1 hypothetical protein [Methylorubrum extorquens]
MTTLIGQFLAVVDAYQAAKERSSDSHLSTLLFNDGKSIGRLRAGKDLHTRSFENGMRWLSANWPEDAVWPAGIVRPKAEPTGSARPARRTSRVAA